MPVALDRILETLLQRQATICWIESGRPPRIVVEGLIRELQTDPTGTEIQSYITTLIGGTDQIKAIDKGEDLKGVASYGDKTMQLAVHASRTLKGYFLELRPLTSSLDARV